MKEILKKSNFIYLFTILVFGLILFTWFRKDLVLSGGDFVFTFSPKTSISIFYSVWSNNVSLGGVNTQSIAQLPYQFFYLLASWLHIPLWLAQQLFFYFLFVMGGIGTYLLVKKLLGLKNIFCLWAALFYMFNPFSLVFVWGINGLLLFAYASYPLLFYLFARGLEERKTKNILHFCLISFLFSAFYGNFSYVVVLWFLFFSFLIFEVLTDKENRPAKIKFFLGLMLSWLLVNSFWLTPYVYGLKRLSTDASYMDSGEILKGASSKASPYNAFRLMGYPVFFEKFMGVDDFYNYASAYQKPFFVMLSFLIPLLCFLTFLTRGFKQSKIIKYFTWLFFFSLFVYKGAQPPFGSIYLWLVRKIPLMVSFRNPLDKVGPLLVISTTVLITFFFSTIENIFKRKVLFYILLAILSFGLLGFLVFPFWTGQVFNSKGKVRPAPLAQMPNYYFELADWLQKQEGEFRILAIPMNNMFGVPYDWEYGHGGSDPLVVVLPKPLVSFDRKLVEIAGNCLMKTPINIVDGTDEGCLASILRLLNVKYLLVHYDIQDKYFNVDPGLDLMKARLKAGYYKGLSYEKSFGRVEIYHLADKSYLPRFYFPQNVSYLKATGDYWMEALKIKIPAEAFFTVPSFPAEYSDNIVDYVCGKRKCTEEVVINDKLGKTVQSFTTVIEDELPKMVIKNQGPGRFLLSVENITSPQFLVFSENYDPQWEAFYKGKKLKHLLVNNFANAWFVEPTPDKNKIIIEVRYRSQSYFWLGVIISIFVYLILILRSFNEARNKQGKKRD